MKNKALALAGCIAATAPTTSIANVLPESLIGLNLGDIRSSSFLNQPFKGVIPFLFTRYENTKNLNVRLAPKFVFDQIGAERHPILSKLNFQITKQNNTPVILISSDQPIQLPFLNFVLEIQSPKGSVYQDYTVLLDPETKQITTSPEVDYISVDQLEIIKPNSSIDVTDGISNNNANNVAPLNADELLKANGAILLSSLSTEVLSSPRQRLKYRVKTGDSLSKIAQQQNTPNTSKKTMSLLIFQKNPKAFVRGDMNRIKKGALLILPTETEINGFELVRKSSSTVAKLEVKGRVSQSSSQLNKNQIKYTVVKGDSLSKITKKFVSSGMSFTKMMNAIYNSNPDAFVNNSKNKIKAGAELSIPGVGQLQVNSNKKSLVDSTMVTNKKAKSVSSQDQLTKTVDIKSNQYRVKAGDTLSYITKHIGYKEVPFAKMLKAIYVNNPDAFVDGKMAKLEVGSIITLPQQSDFKNISTVVTPSEGITAPVNKTTKVEPSALIATTLTNSSTASTDLIKRIRELRKELKQSQNSLSEMKGLLNQKDIILQQKNIQLDNLKTTLTKLNGIVDTSVMTTAAVVVKKAVNNIDAKAVLMPVSATTKFVVKDDYRPKSKAEIAMLKRDLLLKKEKTIQQINKIQALKDKTLSKIKSPPDTENSGFFKNYAKSNVIKFAKNNYSYLTIALLLSLLLVRYRRELYSYTYSAISYDQPTYYPVPEIDKYELKEKNINYYDAKMDEDPSNYEFLTNDPKPVPVEESVVINPLLVEATEKIFDNFEEDKQIEHCEHLVTELFDDLNTNSDNEDDDAEWKDIEKVCDNYIEKIKDADSGTAANKSNALIEEAADFNHMMSDLLESLDKVDQSVKRNNISDDDFPDLVSSTYKSQGKDKQQA